MPTIALNKAATFNYHVLDRVEAGLVLSGSETKAVKNGQINLKGGYVTIHENKKTHQTEVFLINVNISRYKMAAMEKNYDPIRTRKLLLKRQEINYLRGKTQIKGLTIVPLKVYTNRSRIKIEIGLCQGKKLFDKRESLKKRDLDRETNRTFKYQL